MHNTIFVKPAGTFIFKVKKKIVLVNPVIYKCYYDPIMVLFSVFHGFQRWFFYIILICLNYWPEIKFYFSTLSSLYPPILTPISSPNPPLLSSPNLDTIIYLFNLFIYCVYLSNWYVVWFNASQSSQSLF